MGRDIRIESKHLVYRGNKSSDLLMAFDLFFSYFPRHDIKDSVFFNVNLSRKELKQAIRFIEKNAQFFRKPEELLEKLSNIYERMMPKDFVEISIV